MFKHYLRNHYPLFLILIIVLAIMIAKFNNNRNLLVTNKNLDNSYTTNEYAANKIILAIGEWAPFTGESLPSYGIAAEIATEVFKTMDVEYEYQLCPWERALVLVEDGDAWGTFPWFYTDERAEKYLYSKEPIWESKHKFFYYKPNKKLEGKNLSFNTLEDLKPYTFGGAFGYFYEDIFEQDNYNYDLASNMDEAFTMLKYERVDLVIEDEVVGWEIIKRLFPNDVDNFVATENPYKIDKMYMLVSKTYSNSQAILDRYDAALKEIKANGKYQEILNKYGLEFAK